MPLARGVLLCCLRWLQIITILILDKDRTVQAEVVKIHDPPKSGYLTVLRIHNILLV